MVNIDSVQYTRYASNADLSELVEHYWSVVSPAPPGPLRAVLVPNGRATIQFCLGNPGRRFATGVPVQSNADVYLPVETQPVVIEQEGASHYVGIQFTPWGARVLFPGAPQQPTQVTEFLGPLPDKAALAVRPAEELNRWVAGFLPADTGAEIRGRDLLAAAIRRIDEDPTGVQVQQLHAGLHVSASTLYRVFRCGIGLSPKQYIQVIRYRAFTDALLEESGGQPAALVAALSGYADEAHASREFSRFTGMTATMFRDTFDGIARLMARRY